MLSVFDKLGQEIWFLFVGRFELGSLELNSSHQIRIPDSRNKNLDMLRLFDTLEYIQISNLDEPKIFSTNVTQQDDESVECLAQDLQIVSSVRNSKREFSSGKANASIIIPNLSDFFATLNGTFSPGVSEQIGHDSIKPLKKIC